jgi:hypothetical protein
MKSPQPIPSESCSTPAIQLAPVWQMALSGLLVVHLLAICAPPIALATRSGDAPSPAIAPVFNTLRPYIDALYLNHAYFFFAPDPGPSHIARYEIDFEDGRKTLTGQFPDRTAHWPRLLYHRHFMLAETLNDRFAPPNDEPEPQPSNEDSRRAARVYNRVLARWQRQHEEWQVARERYVALRKSVEQHLLATHQGTEVRLSRWEHRQLSPDEFQYDNLALDDPETFNLLPESPSVETLPWNVPRKP